jgi:hypothetical protein
VRFVLQSPWVSLLPAHKEENLAEVHDFDDTVVAVISDRQSADDAAAELTAAGYDVEVLAGAEGQDHLDPAGETGPVATVKRLLNAFGDQYRILDRLNSELDVGNIVISVDAKGEDAEEAVRILNQYEGEFIWKLGAWTYSPAGD